MNLIVVGPPSISSITPGSAAPGGQITITGTNFGSPQGNGNVAYPLGTPPNITGWAFPAIVTWTDTQIVATIPASATAGTVQLQVQGHTLTSPSVAFTVVTSGGPLLQLSIKDAPLEVNLTSAQVLDWIHWSRISAAIPDRKNGIVPLISDYTPVNGAQPSALSGNIAFSWTDGNHPAVVSEANEDIETFTAESGFQITVPRSAMLSR